MNSNFCEMNNEEIMLCEGGVIPMALGVAYLALLGVGFTAGVEIGKEIWF